MVLDVILLALLFFRAAVTPMNIVGRVHSGELPYFEELSKACARYEAPGEQRMAIAFGKSGMGQLPKHVCLVDRSYRSQQRGL